MHFWAARGLVIPVTFCFRVWLNESAFGVQGGWGVAQKAYGVDAHVHTRRRVGEGGGKG